LALDQETRKIVEGFDTTYHEEIDSLVGFGSANHASIGELLVGFYRFYAYEFDYANKVISPRTGGFFTKEQKAWQVSRKVCAHCITTCATHAHV
jgi:DNA polymerase sigma